MTMLNDKDPLNRLFEKPNEYQITNDVHDSFQKHLDSLNTPAKTPNSPPVTSITSSDYYETWATSIQTMPNTVIYNPGSIEDWIGKKPVSVYTYHQQIKVQLDDGSNAVVSRAELIKYIREQKLIEENELVRQMYDRFQVAVKLARSDDNGNG